MWDLHNTGCTLSAWTIPPPPPPPPATTSISFDHDHLDYVHPTNPSTSSPCEDDVSISTTSSSFTNALAHSALTPEPSTRPPVKTAASPSESMVGGYSSINLHLWSHFLLSDGSCEDLDEYRPEIRENLAVPVKSESPGGVFEQAACDYLKKLDDSYWDNPHHFNSIRSSSFIEGERPSKFSDLLTGEWSIATPPHEPYRAISSDLTPSGTVVGKDSDRCTCNSHGNPSFHEKNSSTVGLHQIENKVTACGSARSLTDLISFGSRIIAKPSLDVKVLRPSPAPGVKKRGLKHTSPTGDHSAGEHGTGRTASEGNKRRRREDCSSEKLHKTHKRENSTAASSTKVPVPKVKLGDRIATLQQMVSPFGKTDTASVLMEAIAYIKFLQEQVQLLTSNPYLKTHPLREYAWGRMGQEEAKLDLKSRGLCLVPLSWTPQVCRESPGSDCWASSYRGIFYR